MTDDKMPWEEAHIMHGDVGHGHVDEGASNPSEGSKNGRFVPESQAKALWEGCNIITHEHWRTTNDPSMQYGEFRSALDRGVALLRKGIGG